MQYDFVPAHMHYDLAPIQMYVLLAIVGAVGLFVAAYLPTLLPRRLPEGYVISQKSLVADRRVIKMRRQAVIAIVTLFVLAWTSVFLMIDFGGALTLFHFLHFIILLLFLLFQLILFSFLTHRVKMELLNLLPRPPESGNLQPKSS